MNSIGVRIVVADEAGIPQYANPTDAGCDLRYAGVESVTIEPGSYKLLDTGIKVAIPEGYEGQVRSRSGNALKRGLFVLNSPGTIDSAFRGRVGVILANFSDEEQTIHPMERIAQLVFAPVAHAVFSRQVSLDDTERGSGGFGSTGTK